MTATAPFTCIDNNVILNMAEIGVYGMAVYLAIKMHLNQKTGACFPSYARIAKITGMNRSTVIEYVKKLIALNLIEKWYRYQKHGSHNSNQYDFQCPAEAGYSKEVDLSAKNQGTENSVPSKKIDLPTKNQATENAVPSGGRPEQPPGRPEQPEPSEENKKKEKKEGVVENEPTQKQKTCQHPAPAIIVLPEDNLKICHHCWGLLDENLKLVEDKIPEAVAA
jgi:hypothetical protein